MGKEIIIGGFLNMKIKVKVHVKGCEPQILENGNWIDLSTAEEISLKKGDDALISLGVSIKLPDHMEANLASRSSNYRKYGIIQTNGFGIIDNSYSGENDIWKLPVLATRDITIPKGVRIAQFRIFAEQPHIEFEYVDKMVDENRGGFGSTGV